MVRQHYQLDGHEFEQTLGDSRGHGSLAYCSQWDHIVGYDLATEPPQPTVPQCRRIFKRKQVSIISTVRSSMCVRIAVSYLGNPK